jgi:hypothetical protein
VTEYWVVNGHREDCAYLRSLDDPLEEGPCDCERDEDEPRDDDDEY